jgi:hypothetical protein
MFRVIIPYVINITIRGKLNVFFDNFTNYSVCPARDCALLDGVIKIYVLH